MFHTRTVNALRRIVVSALCLFLVVQGLAGVFGGKWIWSNYWGDTVAAPLAILVGAFGFWFSIWGPKSKRGKRHDLLVDERGRRIRFPADDYQKW